MKTSFKVSLVVPLMALCFVWFVFPLFGQIDTKPSLPLHPATTEQIQKIVTLTHTTERVQKMMLEQIAVQKKSGPQFFPAAFWDDMQGELTKIDWVKIAVPVYQRYFSVEEADAVIAFYSTPVGQKTLNSSMAASQELYTQGFSLGKEIGQRIGQKYSKEIEENMKKMQQQASPAQSSPSLASPSASKN